jgi:uncharacterized protein YijF (DUF1287 family)
MRDDGRWDDSIDDLADVAPRRGATRGARRSAAAKTRTTNGEPTYDKFPRAWTLKMKDSNVGAFKLALLLLHLHWKARGKPFVVSNAAAAERGIGHWRKISAIAELEKLGLIRVKRRPKKSSLITLVLPRGWCNGW